MMALVHKYLKVLDPEELHKFTYLLRNIPLHYGPKKHWSGNAEILKKRKILSMFYGFGGIRSKVWRRLSKSMSRRRKQPTFEAQLEQRLELFYLEHII